MIQKIRQDKSIGDNLRELRLKHEISQEALCVELQRRGCDIGRSAYQKYEAGNLNVKVTVLKTLKDIYNCNFDDFFKDI